jgi:hypothetical protein
MSHTTPITTHQQINLTYVIRLSWDQASGEWRILLKPVNGQEARLFGDVESMLVYLEAVMQKECKEEQE